jgi:uncharacterized membrane protein YeiH
MQPITLSLILNYISTCVFAFSGTKVALHRGDSLFVAVLAGIVTACGGGTMIDTLNGRLPFWVKQPGYMIVSVIFSIMSIFSEHGPKPVSPIYGL